MKKNKMTVLFNAKIKSFEKLNDNFLKAKCYVLALGKNVNKSYFDEGNVNKAYSSLQFAPVVGHLMEDDNGNHYLGGHDMKLDLTNGIKLKTLCVPFGVAIPSPSPQYEDVIEEDGTISKYLVSDIVLWTGRYPELAEAMYNEDIYFWQSMEISYTESQPLTEDNSYQNILDFTIDALCLLNKSDDEKFNISPCFPSASVVSASYGLNDRDEFVALMNELKQELSFCLNNETIKKEGEVEMNEKEKILQKYNKTINDLDFSIDDLTEVELSNKMQELFEEKKEAEVELFSTTYKEKWNALKKLFEDKREFDNDGNLVKETYHYVFDYDDIFAYVDIDTYTKDKYSNQYFRFPYTYNDESKEYLLSGESEEVFRILATSEEKDTLDEERQNFELTKKEAKELKAYKKSKEAEDHLTKAREILEKFSKKIGETEEFKKLVQNLKSNSLVEIEKECTYILGLYTAKNDAGQNNKTNEQLKFSIDKNRDADEQDAYGGLFDKYLKK